MAAYSDTCQWEGTNRQQAQPRGREDQPALRPASGAKYRHRGVAGQAVDSGRRGHDGVVVDRP